MMKRVFLILFLILFIVGVIENVHAARIYGSIYDSHLNTINQVVVEVNSSPHQRHVSKYGGYSFDLGPGTYEITATMNKNGTSYLIADQNVTVSNPEGQYIVDLFAYPDLNLTSGSSDRQAGIKDWLTLNWFFISIGLLTFAVVMLVVLTVVIFYRFRRRDPEVSYNVEISEHESQIGAVAEVDSDQVEHITTATINKKEAEVLVSDSEDAISMAQESNSPVIAERISGEISSNENDTKKPNAPEDDLLKKRIIKLMEENDGQMTQKDIRKKIPLSESKISQVISDLCSENLLKKEKSGRSNVLILVRSESKVIPAEENNPKISEEANQTKKEEKKEN